MGYLEIKELLPETSVWTRAYFNGVIKRYTFKEVRDGITKVYLRKTDTPVLRKPLAELKEDRILYNTYIKYYQRFLYRNIKRGYFRVQVRYNVKDQVEPIEEEYINLRGKDIYDQICRDAVTAEGLTRNPHNIQVLNVLNCTDMFVPDDIRKIVERMYESLLDDSYDEYMKSLPQSIRALVKYIKDKVDSIVEEEVRLEIKQFYKELEAKCKEGITGVELLTEQQSEE